MFPAWPKILDFLHYRATENNNATANNDATADLLIYYTANMVHWPMPFDSNRPIMNAGL